MDVGRYTAPRDLLLPLDSDVEIEDVCLQLRERGDKLSNRAALTIETIHHLMQNMEAAAGIHLDQLTRRRKRENDALWSMMRKWHETLGERDKQIDALPEDVRDMLKVLDTAIGFIVDNPQRSREAVVKIQKRLDDYLKETGDEREGSD